MAGNTKDRVVNASRLERNARGKANHLAKVCRQENPSPKKERKERIHQFGTSPESQDSSDEEYCFTLTLKGSEEYVNNLDSSSFKSKIFATMKVGGQPVRFQVDSGATCNVISKTYYPKNVRSPRAHKF